MKTLSKSELSTRAKKRAKSREAAFAKFEAREDVRAVFVKIQKSKGFTRKAAEEAFACVEPTQVGVAKPQSL